MPTDVGPPPPLIDSPGPTGEQDESPPDIDRLSSEAAPPAPAPAAPNDAVRPEPEDASGEDENIPEQEMAAGPAPEPDEDDIATNDAKAIKADDNEPDWVKVEAELRSIRDRQDPGPPKGRPTPQSVIEAVLVSVHTRGLAALREPASVERLSRCDAAAKAQINERIAKLEATGSLKGGIVHA